MGATSQSLQDLARNLPEKIAALEMLGRDRLVAAAQASSASQTILGRHGVEPTSGEDFAMQDEHGPTIGNDQKQQMSERTRLSPSVQSAASGALREVQHRSESVPIDRYNELAHRPAASTRGNESQRALPAPPRLPQRLILHPPRPPSGLGTNRSISRPTPGSGANATPVGLPPQEPLTRSRSGLTGAVALKNKGSFHHQDLPTYGHNDSSVNDLQPSVVQSKQPKQHLRARHPNYPGRTIDREIPQPSLIQERLDPSPANGRADLPSDQITLGYRSQHISTTQERWTPNLQTVLQDQSQPPPSISYPPPNAPPNYALLRINDIPIPHGYRFRSLIFFHARLGALHLPSNEHFINLDINDDRDYGWGAGIKGPAPRYGQERPEERARRQSIALEVYRAWCNARNEREEEQRWRSGQRWAV